MLKCATPASSSAPSGPSGSVAPSEPPVASALREAVLAGPGGRLAGAVAETAPLWVLVTPEEALAALAAAGHVGDRRAVLVGEVTVALLVGRCLFLHEGAASVIRRLWPQLAAFHPRTVLDGPVTDAAFSYARGQLAPAVVRALFEADAARGDLPEARGARRFGLLLTATDSTVFDLRNRDGMAERFATPTGGRCPQARVVTVVAAGTRCVLAAEVDSSSVSEQELFDRLLAALKPGTLNLADRGFFSMERWQKASATGAALLWRVRNGHHSLPARVLRTLLDGSQLVLLRESASMLSRRRARLGDKKAPRLPDTIARLVEFTVTVTDQAGTSTSSRYRVLTTLLDHVAHPAEQIAACSAERWQAELTYKAIKSTLRGAAPELHGESAPLAEQELWGLLFVHNTLVDQAVAAAVELGVDPDTISYTAVLRAARDHLTGHAPCTACGHLPAQADLTAAICAAPRNRTDRHRTSPRTPTQRRTQRSHYVTYTIEITPSDLPKTDEAA
ncbi:IS4 family transposase [Protofrankia symbiont of Coriaria ruscifolia]|uniref:IS4 family transposase n=1 Tax=Protofrankia symbiont of Coriaria ruscifolia TaxID=1306542 RepID=UPI0010419A28|nr:IS4 family transposase [Protofrankia symbiont of Coriaria ruscifolia]